MNGQSAGLYVDAQPVAAHPLKVIPDGTVTCSRYGYTDRDINCLAWRAIDYVPNAKQRGVRVAEANSRLNVVVLSATHLGVLMAGVALHALYAPAPSLIRSRAAPAQQAAEGAVLEPSSHPAEPSGLVSGTHWTARADADAGVRPSCPSPAEVVGRSIPALLHYIRERDHDLSPETTAERVANASNLYTDGWADAFLTSEPNAYTALATALNAELCSSGHGAVENLLLLRLVGRISRSERSVRIGVDCVLAHTDREGVVLWSALDVWQRGGYGSSEAIDHIRTTFTDSRTTERLLPLSDRLALRDGTQAFEDGPSPSAQ